MQVPFLREGGTMQTISITEIHPRKACSEALPSPDADAIAAILRGYGVTFVHSIGLIDSSHGADDIRWNYIINKKYVLRLCNAPEMTETRMEDLNRLIGRYRAFGLRCPAFRKAKDGGFFRPWNDLLVYLSDYIDLPLAENKEGAEADALRDAVVRSIAGFLERYRDVDLSPTMGMYSLFDLCPFDVPEGIDEKQQNMNTLCDALRKIGQVALAEKLEAKNRAARAYLLPIYRALPHCVTQGDENFTNVLLDEQGHMAGLIDFNLAGTDVCVNLIANNADFNLDEMGESPIDPDKALSDALRSYRKNAEMLLGIYHATEQERAALPYYAWIAFVSMYPHVCAFVDRLKNDAARSGTLALLERIADLAPEALYV